MSAMFQKKPAARPQPLRKEPRVTPAKPAKSEDSKTPVTRVGEGRTHHDSISTKVLYLLVDEPKAPPDPVSLAQGSHAWPMMFTNDAQPLSDTILVSALTFEPVADVGQLTLKIRHGASQWDIEIFTGIDSKDFFIDDPDVVFGPKTEEGAHAPANLRTLDYRAIKPHPFADDPDLGKPDGPERPFMSLVETGS